MLPASLTRTGLNNTDAGEMSPARTPLRPAIRELHAAPGRAREAGEGEKIEVGILVCLHPTHHPHPKARKEISQVPVSDSLGSEYIGRAQYQKDQKTIPGSVKKLARKLC